MLAEQVHKERYADAFCQNALSEAEMKRIGFGELCLQPILVERTLAEIAGENFILVGARCMLLIQIVGSHRLIQHSDQANLCHACLSVWS